MSDDILDKKANDYGVKLSPVNKEVAEQLMLQAQAEENRYSAQMESVRKQIEAERKAQEQEAERKRLQAAHDKSAQKLEGYKAFYRARWIANGGSEYDFSRAWVGIKESIVMGVIDPEKEIQAGKRSSGMYDNII